MPGCRLPIRPVEVLVDRRPDDLLILAWNFADEIVSQQREFAAAGGSFYVPVPSPRRVDPPDWSTELPNTDSVASC